MDNLVTVGFSCYAGWFPIIERYFDEVARILKEHPGAIYDLWHVKEKFAGLRLYAGTSLDICSAVQVAYDRVEASLTCEACGKAGQLRKRGGWFMTRCDDHADGGLPVGPEGETG